jgi:hypothetical protein
LIYIDHMYNQFDQESFQLVIFQERIETIL